MSLARYVTVRGILAVPTLLILLAVVFFIMRILPGDPVTQLLGDHLTDAQAAVLRHQWGLDAPTYVQFIQYLSNIIVGNFGISISTQEPVALLIEQSFPATLELTLLALFFGSGVGILLAVLSVRKVGGIVDQVVRAFTVWSYSIPVFWLAVLLQIGLGVWFPILPVSGRLGSDTVLHRITGLNLVDSILTLNGTAFFDSVQHLILPVFLLSLFCMPIVARICRASMVGTFSEQYMVTAKSKGLSFSSIVLRYSLRNALIPTVTVIGATMMDLLGGSVVTESIFGWPGMGRLFLSAATNRDFPLMQGIAVVYMLLVISLSISLDIIYTFVDPRIRFTRFK